MPLVSFGQSRRQFLLGALALSRVRGSAPPASWAFLSDTHLAADPENRYRGFSPHENLRKALAGVLAAKPSAAIISGDLARLEGLPGDYQALESILRPAIQEMPLSMALGNHDHRQNFLRVFSGNSAERQTVANKYVLVSGKQPVRIVVLDSLLSANITPGLLGKAQRLWLSNFLETSDQTPTLLVVHHTLDDADGSLLDAPRMFDIVTRFKKVKAILYGHSHRYRYDVQDGIHLVNLPAVGYNFADGEPVGWVEANLTAEGGDFKLHAVGGNAAADGKVTSLRWRS